MHPYINHLAGFGSGFIAFFPVAAISVNVPVATLGLSGFSPSVTIDEIWTVQTTATVTWTVQ